MTTLDSAPSGARARELTVAPVDPALPEPPRSRLPMPLATIAFGKYRYRLLPALQRRYGPVFQLRIAPHRRRMVLLADPDDIKRVFSGPSTVFHAGEGNAILGPIMGQDSVLLLDEAEHVRIRQLLMPAFHGAALRGYRDLIAEIAHEQIDRWPLGRPVALHARMQSLTLEVILKVVFGVVDETRLARLRPVVDRVLDLSPVLMLGWFYPRLRSIPPWRGFAEIQRTLDELLYAEIAERRRVPDLAERTDVLSRLLRISAEDAGSTAAPLTDAELRDNLITLLLAGHETTATSLAWAFYEFSRDRDALERAQQHADAGDEAYLEAVFKESMRLHPIIYEVARHTTADVEIGGYRVPRGSTVMPAIGLVQANPDFHRDPARFDPERFLTGQPKPNTWIPFGGGVRRCLGAGFAQLEASVVLAEVLTRFDLLPGRARSEHPRARNITLAPSAGARVILRARG